MTPRFGTPAWRKMVRERNIHLRDVCGRWDFCGAVLSESMREEAAREVAADYREMVQRNLRARREINERERQRRMTEYRPFPLLRVGIRMLPTEQVRKVGADGSVYIYSRLRWTMEPER